MKNNQKKDELMIKFQSSKIERNKLDRILGGKLITTAGSDITTGVTSGGNHDNTVSAPDKYYDGTR